MTELITPVTTTLLTAWKSRDEPVVAASADLVLGRTTVSGDPVGQAAALYRSGARRVRLDDPVDLRSPAVVPALLLIRDLSRHGVVVDWHLVLDEMAHDWRELSHFEPPRALSVVLGTGAMREDAAALLRWRQEFHYCRFIVRRGPGFVQIRDRRWSRPRLMTISAPDPLALVESLLAGPVDVASAPSVAGDLEEARILQRIGDRLWMPAYRVRRWPMPAEFV